jgi:hypothetical protein
MNGGACLTGRDTYESEDDQLGRMIHSFIVKIWREEPERGKALTWRGYITHVPSNQRLYLKSLADIPEFIKTYLWRMGMRVGLCWRVKQWLKKGTI